MKQTVPSGRKDACGISDLPIALITAEMFSAFSSSARFYLENLCQQTDTLIQVNLYVIMDRILKCPVKNVVFAVNVVGCRCLDARYPPKLSVTRLCKRAGDRKYSEGFMS